MGEDVSELLRQIDRVRRAWQNVTPCETLSKSQFVTLLAIANPEHVCGMPDAPDCRRTVRLTELARAMRQSMPALSQRVSALEALGYVERVPDPADRRVTGLCVTDEGRRVMQEAYRRFGGMIARAVDRMGKEELRTLLRLLASLAEGLELAAADPDGTMHSTIKE